MRAINEMNDFSHEAAKRGKACLSAVNEKNSQ